MLVLCERRIELLDKFITKENIIIVVLVFWTLLQSNYFATKLDLANVKLEMSQLKNELKKYADDGDRELLHNIDTKYQLILTKLDKLHGR
jgi:hypothetical protein